MYRVLQQPYGQIIVFGSIFTQVKTLYAFLPIFGDGRLNGVWVDRPSTDSGTTNSRLQQAFSWPCMVIATVSYTHRVLTLREVGVGKHSPF